MPGKKKSGSKKTTQAKGTKTRRTGESPASDKAGLKSQSVRFTHNQMEEIEKARKAKGWSNAQLMQRATIEKVVAINEMQDYHKRREILRAISTIAEGLRGQIPIVSVRGVQLANPEDEMISTANYRRGEFVDWQYNEFVPGPRGGLSIEIAAKDVNASEQKGGLDQEQLQPIRMALFNFESRRIDLISDECPEDAVPLATVSPNALSDEKVEQITNCIRVLCPELADLLKEAYLELKMQLPFGAETFRTAQDLLEDDRQTGGSNWPTAEESRENSRNW